MHISQLQIRISLGSYPNQPASTVYETEIEWIGPFDQESFERDFAELVRARGEFPQPFTLDITTSEFSWGASNAGAQILAYVAEHGFDATIGVVFEESVRRLFKVLRGRRKPNQYLDAEDRYNPVTREEALERAKWRVSTLSV